MKKTFWFFAAAPRWILLWLSLSISVSGVQAEEKGTISSCQDAPFSTSTATTCSKSASLTERKTGTLKPSDLPEPVLFENWNHNATITFNTNGTLVIQEYAQGSVNQINNHTRQGNIPVDASAYSLPLLVDKKSASTMFSLLASYARKTNSTSMDLDPDSVDGMPTYELVLENKIKEMPGKKESNKMKQVRSSLRKQLLKITKPLLQHKITPLVRSLYPEVCNTTNPERACTPCYSLIRQYRHGERQTHWTHHDGHAFITVVVSLSNYGQDYRGGLYVSTGHGQREFLALNRGDGVMHRSSLLHGVQVLDIKEQPQNTARWSWILWYRDSESCHDYSVEWYSECSNAGDPLCQQLHANKVKGLTNLTEQEKVQEIIRLNKDAAQGGSGEAAIKIARAYLHRLKISKAVPFDINIAKEFYNIAIQSNNPEGYYGMAELLVAEVTQDQQTKGLGVDSPSQSRKLVHAIYHLEQAAVLGHAFSMFNLGIAHVYGYGIPNHAMDLDLAMEWFVQSGIPEGLFLAAQLAEHTGNLSGAQVWRRRAQYLGHNQPWRQHARKATGSGGAGGIDINFIWPISIRGNKPQMF